MKNVIFILSVIVISVLTSCSTQSKLASYNDDVYANPSEDRKEEARLAAIKKQQQEEAYKRYNDSLSQAKAEQKAKDDANPYYKDREFKYDDYYDYEYATRIKRFDNQIYGLGYYDNYYTNSYWYNQNPYYYGTSVYNGYCWWGNGYNMYSYNPSLNFYYNNGWYSSYPSYGYMGYNPYNNWGNSYWQGYYNGFNNGYHNGYYNGWNGYPYYGYGYNTINPYGNYYGYGSGYNNGNGWGYYNSYDNNSGYTYGPRSSHGGGNSERTSSAGMSSNVNNSYYNNLLTSVSDKQNKAVKFDNAVIATKSNYAVDNSVRVNSKGQVIDATSKPYSTDNAKNIGNNKNTYDATGVKNNPDVYAVPKEYNKGTTSVKQNEVYYNKTETVVKEKPSYQNTEVKSNRGSYDNSVKSEVKQKSFEAPAVQEHFQRNNFNTPNNNTPSNTGGGSTSPSNRGGSQNGGGGRPR